MLMSESPEYYHERELVALSVEKQQQKIDSEAFLNSAREITDLVKDQTQTNFTDAQVETPSSTKASTHSSLSSSSAIITPGIQQPKTTVNLFPSFPSATNDRDNEKPQNLDQEVTDSVKKPTQTNLNPLPSSVSTSKFRDVKKPMQEKKVRLLLRFDLNLECILLTPDVHITAYLSTADWENDQNSQSQTLLLLVIIRQSDQAQKTGNFKCHSFYSIKGKLRLQFLFSVSFGTAL